MRGREEEEGKGEGRGVWRGHVRGCGGRWVWGGLVSGAYLASLCSLSSRDLQTQTGHTRSCIHQAPPTLIESLISSPRNEDEISFLGGKKDFAFYE